MKSPGDSCEKCCGEGDGREWGGRNMVCKAVLRPHLGGLTMVKHTHDEFQYIQLSINYESPALLAMHQLRGRQTKDALYERVHGAEEKSLCSTR